MFCDPFNLFKATFIGLGSFFLQLPSFCLTYVALPSIHVAEYTLANPPSPISFISVNLSNGTHSRNPPPYPLASYIVSFINLSISELPLVHPSIILYGSHSLHHN